MTLGAIPSPTLDINGSTQVFYILGDPVAQVRAPEVYNHLFRQHGINAVLVPLKLPAAALPGFLAHGMNAHNVGGFGPPFRTNLPWPSCWSQATRWRKLPVRSTPSNACPMAVWKPRCLTALAL